MRSSESPQHFLYFFPLPHGQGSTVQYARTPDPIAENTAKVIQHSTGRAAREAARARLDFDPKPVVNLFTPHWYARWLLTDIDPEYPQRAFGLCDLGDGCPYLGYVSLHDFEDTHGKIKCTVAADPHFVADKPLSIYADVAYTRGLIVT